MTVTLKQAETIITNARAFRVEGDPHIVSMLIDIDYQDRDITLYVKPARCMLSSDVDQTRKNLSAAMDRFKQRGFAPQGSRSNWFVLRFDDLDRVLNAMECSPESIELVKSLMPKQRHTVPYVGL